MTKISYAGYRFPPVIIQQAVWLYARFTLSFRDVEDLLAERGVMVSYETVRRWVKYFGPVIAADLRRRRPKPVWSNNSNGLKDGRSVIHDQDSGGGASWVHSRAFNDSDGRVGQALTDCHGLIRLWVGLRIRHGQAKEVVVVHDRARSLRLRPGKVQIMLGAEYIAIETGNPAPPARGNIQTADTGLDVRRNAAPKKMRIFVNEV
jgi:hypothetical protein